MATIPWGKYTKQGSLTYLNRWKFILLARSSVRDWLHALSSNLLSKRLEKHLGQPRNTRMRHPSLAYRWRVCYPAILDNMKTCLTQKWLTVPWQLPVTEGGSTEPWKLLQYAENYKGELCQGSSHSEQNLFKHGSIILAFIAYPTLSYWVKIMWALIAQLLRVFGCITGCVPRCWGEAAFLSSSDYSHNLFPYKFISLGQELLLASDWRPVFGPGVHAHLRARWASLSLDCWGGPWDK